MRELKIYCDKCGKLLFCNTPTEKTNLHICAITGMTKDGYELDLHFCEECSLKIKELLEEDSQNDSNTYRPDCIRKNDSKKSPGGKIRI